MIIEIDTQFLIDNKITAHQFIIAKLISENKIPLLKKYIAYSETLNDLYRDLGQLKTAGFLSTTFNPRNFISLDTIEVSQKFVKACSFSEDPFDEFFAKYPIKALRPDGTFDYLRVDKDKCRKLYHNIVRKQPTLHTHIMKCMLKEVNDRELKGKISYMKRMPVWLSSESWKAYEDRVESDSNPTLEEKSKAYGSDIE